MAWTYLVIAGLMEIVWATGLKYTEGFTKPLPSAATIAAMIVSFYFLSLALRTLPLAVLFQSRNERVRVQRQEQKEEQKEDKRTWP